MITTPTSPASSGSAAKAANRVPSAASSSRSLWSTAPPSIGGTGGSESRSKHMGASLAGTRLEPMAKEFTSEDFATRMERAGRAAQEAGLSGLLVTPGADLLYLTGYAPMITERLTMLVLSAEREPALIVPVLERPDAESAPGSSRLELSDWADGTDPYESAAPLLDPKGRYAISDAAWAMHVLGLQRRLPDTGYVSMAEALPTLRAVKDADELARLAVAGEAADAAFYDILEVRFAGRTEREIGADLAEALEAHG